MPHRLKGDARLPAASRGIARLARISDWADSRHNVFVRLSEIPLLFTLQLAYAAESWRRDHGSRLRDWVGAVGEMEALLSFAGYSYEHPSYPFPDVVDGQRARVRRDRRSRIRCCRATAVSNSLALDGSQARKPASPQAPQVLIVSGSNMSGKSTLMRTVGINAVLALAGAPVRAEQPAPDAAGDRDMPPSHRFAAGASIGLLYRGAAYPRDLRSARRAVARAVPVRRTA